MPYAIFDIRCSLAPSHQPYPYLVFAFCRSMPVHSMEALNAIAFAYVHVFVECTAIHSGFIMCDYTNPKPIYFRCYNFDICFFLCVCCRSHAPNHHFLFCSCSFAILFSTNIFVVVCGSWPCILNVIVLLCFSTGPARECVCFGMHRGLV